MKKRVGSGSIRGTDPGIRIRIRTKMSWIPNTAKKTEMVPVSTSNFELQTLNIFNTTLQYISMVNATDTFEKSYLSFR